MEVNESTAKFFYAQIFGSHNGHMASIPNNPQLQALLSAHGVKDELTCAEFLKAVSEHLIEQNF